MARDGRGCERKCASRTKMARNWSGGMPRARATRMARATGGSVDAGRAEEWVTRKRRVEDGEEEEFEGEEWEEGKSREGAHPKETRRRECSGAAGAAAAVWVWHTGTLCLSFLALCCLCTRPLATGPATSQSQKDGFRRTDQSATPAPPCLQAQARAGGRPEGVMRG